MLQKYYEGTSKIINLSTEIGRLLGIVDATHIRKPKTELRRANRIETIHSSLQIEGNTLSVDQVTDIFDNVRVIGPAQDIVEVRNAIDVYRDLAGYDPFDHRSYLKAHKLLMSGLVPGAGKYRIEEVGVFKGAAIAHMAPPAWNVHHLMDQLFNYLKESPDNLIIKSCVFHYEMEFVHPFADGNGRMGRLWQTIILMQENPVFEFLPIESGILESQQEYYAMLALSDKDGMATKFVEYILALIRDSLAELINAQRAVLTDTERVLYFKEHTDLSEFTRKDYMNMFRSISSATATRDLKKGVERGVLIKEGANRLTVYKFRVAK
ncbi:MAG: Fic family protein [Bacteroidetes bacterium]|nr:MAG: Fic family protein [Bacteroidota bacterium]